MASPTSHDLQADGAARVEHLFVTPVYRSALGGRGADGLRAELVEAAQSLAAEDRAGQRWCREHGYKGYTSYASLDDLPRRMPPFAQLAKALGTHVAAFSAACAHDLAGRKLVLDSLWVNVLPPGGVHSGHIHPHSVVSGTYYASVPDGASALKLEDPRLAMMMAQPVRHPEAQRGLQPFVFLAPRAGEVILWESWLRHEVVMNRSRSPRISVSFNYAWR
jgi:uncharacterized protein (TIGR02466 family)